VPILGATGALGYGLSLRLALASVPTVIGSRSARRAAATARRVEETARRRVDGQAPGLRVDAALNVDATALGRIVIVCVPFEAQADVLSSIAGRLEPGQVLVDTTVALAPAVAGRDARLAEAPQGSSAERAQRIVPAGVSVVAALQTVSAASLGDLEHDLDEDVLLTGDDTPAKRAVAQLLSRVPGLRPVDCGRLGSAGAVEALAPLLMTANRHYRSRAGIRLTGLREPLW